MVPNGQQQELIHYMISPTNVVTFHGSDYMSTFHKSPMKIDSFDYPSIEHYYQACKLYKFGGAELAKLIQGVKEPYQCKAVARNALNNIKVPRTKIEEWRRDEAPEILIHAYIYKFAQNRHMLAKLLATGDALLVHSFAGDNLYAIGMAEEDTKKWALDNNGKVAQVPRYFNEWFVKRLPTCLGKGKNMLGVLLMMVREAFRPQRNRADEAIVSLIRTRFPQLPETCIAPVAHSSVNLPSDLIAH